MHAPRELEAGADWSYYKHPLSEHVYDIYMQYWRGVTFEF